MHCLQALLLKHSGLWEMLWRKTPELKMMVAAYPTYAEFRLVADCWEGRRALSSRFEQIGPMDDYVAIDTSAPDFHSELSCLSGKNRGKPTTVPNLLLSALCDGNKVLTSPSVILIPISSGETKGIILHFGYSPHSVLNSSVWGCCLHRQADGILFQPMPAAALYRCILSEVYYR